MTYNELGTRINKNPPWKGFRKYNILLADNKLVLTASTGKQSWTLDKDTLVYKDKEWGEDKDEIIRYWKRIE